MASRKESSAPPPAKDTNLVLTYEALLRGMEHQKQIARDMAQRARQMYEQALKMREQNQRASLP